MIRTIIALLSCLVAIVGLGQESTENNITVLSGQFAVYEAPVELNLPDDFIMIEGSDARGIFVDLMGVPPERVENVFGIIIPDTTSSIFYLNHAYILTYDKIGHVVDNDADDFDLKSIINPTKVDENGVTRHWAWDPYYIKKDHELSMPIISSKGGESYNQHTLMKFGRDGVISLRSLNANSDPEWYRDNGHVLANSISFANGHRYQDYRPEKDGVAYYSIEDYLLEKPAKGPMSVSREFDLEVDSIKLIGYASAVLIIALLTLLLIVALTKPRKESSDDIAQLSMNTLLRIFVFAVVYLLILVFAIFLVWAGVELTIWILTSVISIKILIGIVAGWAFIGSFLYSVVRSLFIFHKSSDPYRLQISEKDAPELFALIREVASNIGEPMPVKVYLSPDANACVFYAHPLLSIFHSKGKNLVVGVGLLYGLNRNELKAIIAHEYGHFGQKSMRVSQIVSPSYEVISNLINSGGTSIVRPILWRTFLYVQRGYMALSRAMEYEADQTGAEVAGNVAMVSSLCKVQVISDRMSAYQSMVNGIFKTKGVVPSTYFRGYEMFLTLCHDYDGIELTFETIALKPISEKEPSEVDLKNPWLSHPLIQERITNIMAKIRTSDVGSPSNANGIVPDNIKELVSDLIYKENYPNATLRDDDTYIKLLKKELSERTFPLKLRPYFNRDLCGFKVEQEGISDDAKSSDEVFNDINRQAILSFVQAIEDYRLMILFKNKQAGEKRIRYKGKIYSRKNVPIEEQLAVLQKLEKNISEIDKSVYLFAMSIVSDKNLIIKAYDNIYYSQNVISHINREIIPHRDGVARAASRSGNLSRDEFNRLQMMLLNFKNMMLTFIRDIDIHRLDPVMHVDTVRDLERINSDILLTGDSISGEEIQYVLSLPDQFLQLFSNLAYYSKKIVSDSIEGKVPLMYWDHSVAFENRKL